MSMGGSSGGSGGGGGMPWAQIGATVGEIADYHIGKRQNALASRVEQQQQNKANKLYTDLYNQTSADYLPYQQGGTQAYDALLSSYGLTTGPSFLDSSEYKGALEAYNAQNSGPQFDAETGRPINPHKQVPFEQSAQFLNAQAAYDAGRKQHGAPDYSGFYNSPDYQFAFSQGQRAQESGAGAKGRLYSGAQIKAGQAFGQGLASQYLGNYRNGLQGIAGQGMNANNALANYRMGYGNQLGQGYTNIGDIAGAEYLGNAALHRRFVNGMNDAWGVGSGGGQSGGFGGGQSSFGGSSGSGYGSMTGPGTSSFDFGSGNNWQFGGGG